MDGEGYTVEPLTERGEVRYVVKDPHGAVVNGVRHKSHKAAEHQRQILDAFWTGVRNQRRSA